MQAPDAHSLHQNIAIISGDLHAHKLYPRFYEKFCNDLHGTPGICDLCVQMAEALTRWETQNGGMHVAYEKHNVDWIGLVENYVDAMLKQSCSSGTIPDARQLLTKVVRGS